MSIKTCLFELRQLWILLPPSWFCSLCWLSHWRSHLQLLLYTGKTLLLTCPYPFEMGDIRIFFQDWECQEGWGSMLRKRETAGSRPQKHDQPVWKPKGCDGNGISEVENIEYWEYYILRIKRLWRQRNIRSWGSASPRWTSTTSGGPPSWSRSWRRGWGRTSASRPRFIRRDSRDSKRGSMRVWRTIKEILKCWRRNAQSYESAFSARQ